MKPYKSIIILIMLLLEIIFYFSIEQINLYSISINSIILIIFYMSDRILNLEFKKQHYLYLIIIILSSLFFDYLQLKILYIDKILHFIGAIMLTSITYHTSKKIKISKNHLLMAIILSLLIIISYEFYEYFSDQLFNTTFQGVYQKINNQLVLIIEKTTDTLQDIFLGILGIIIYSIYNLTSIRKRNRKKK